MCKIYRITIPEGKKISAFKFRGFTLIELLVVVLIIAVLSVLILPSYRIAVAKTRFAQLQIFGDAIYKAEQLHFMSRGSYTNNFSSLPLGIPGTVSNDGETLVNGQCQCRILIGFYNGMDLLEYNCSYEGGLLGGIDVPVYIGSLTTGKSYCRTMDMEESSIPYRVCLSLGDERTKHCAPSKGYCQFKLH